jgi:hypothetical protein
MCEVAREDRFQTAEEMGAAMSTEAPPRSRTHPLAIAIASIAVVVGALALVLSRSSGPEESVAPPTGGPARSGGTEFQQGLLVIDPETGEEIARYPGSFGTGVFASGHAEVIAAGNGAVWTTDDQAKVLRIEPSTGEATPVPRADCGLDAIATGLGSTWVVCPGSTVGTVVQIDPFELTGRDIEMPGNLGTTSGVGTGGANMWIAASGPLVRFDQLDRRAEVIECLIADDVAVDQSAVWIVDELASTYPASTPEPGHPFRRWKSPAPSTTSLQDSDRSGCSTGAPEP